MWDLGIRTVQKVLQREIAAALISVFLILSQLGHPRAQNPSSQTQVFGTPLVSLQFEEYIRKLWVLCRVNGSAPLAFLIDTGAESNIIDSAVSGTLNLASGATFQLQGAGPSRSDGRFLRPVRFEIGGLVVQESFGSLDLSKLSASFGRHIDGILGSPFLSKYAVTIDPDLHTITLAPPMSTPEDGAIPLRVQEGLPLIKLNVSIDGKSQMSGDFVLDTGMDDSLDLSRKFVATNGLAPELEKLRGMEVIAFGIGGTEPIRYARIAALTIAGHVMKSPVISSGSTPIGGPFDEAGVVGYEVLRRFRFTLDYRARRAILHANRFAKESFEVDMSGLTLTTLDRDFTRIAVRAVRSDSPAAKARLIAGDEIVSVNGESAGRLGIHRLDQMFRLAGKQYRLAIRRAGKDLMVSITTRRSV